MGGAHAAPKASPVPGASPVPTAQAAQTAQTGGSYVQVKLQKALADLAGQIPDIEPWQTRLLNEEILPQAQRFVRDYRATPQGNLTVDVDFESVKNYLKFFAPKSLKKENPAFLALVRAEEGCAKCEEARPALRKLAQERIERRGAVPVFLGADEVDAKLSGKALDDRLAQLVADKKASGSLLLHAYKAPFDDVDTAHADEIRYVARAALVVKDVSKHEGQLELFEAGSFEKNSERLLTDFFADLGTKLDKAVLAGMGAEKQEREGIPLEVSGFRNFQQYSQLKEKIQALATDGLLVEERKVARGRVVFSVFTDKPVEEIQKLLRRIEMPRGSALRMELKP